MFTFFSVAQSTPNCIVVKDWMFTSKDNLTMHLLGKLFNYTPLRKVFYTLVNTISYFFTYAVLLDFIFKNVRRVCFLCFFHTEIPTLIC